MVPQPLYDKNEHRMPCRNGERPDGRRADQGPDARHRTSRLEDHDDGNGTRRISKQQVLHDGDLAEYLSHP